MTVSDILNSALRSAKGVAQLRACEARMYGTLDGFLRPFIEAEQIWGTPPATILIAANGAAVTLVIEALMNNCPERQWAEVAVILRAALIEELDDAIAAIAQFPPAPASLGSPLPHKEGRNNAARR